MAAARTGGKNQLQMHTETNQGVMKNQVPYQANASGFFAALFMIKYCLLLIHSSLFMHVMFTARVRQRPDSENSAGHHGSSC